MTYDQKVKAAKDAIVAEVKKRTGMDITGDGISILFNDTAMEITKIIAVDYSAGGGLNKWLYKVTLDVTDDPMAKVDVYQKLD